MTEWQPISTAPKDGTRILAYQDGEYVVVYWLMAPDGLGGWHESSSDACQIYPTDWQSLPAPPQT